MSSPATEAKPGMAEADPYRYGWRYVARPDERGLPVPVRQPLTYEDVLHPQEGDFIVQNSTHHPDVYYLEHAFNWILNGRQDVRVLADMRTDWGVEGIKPHGPDVVVFAGPRDREPPHFGTYKPKEWGTSPVLAVEVTSPSTRAQDVYDKVWEYYRAGIPYYAIVDYLTEEDGGRAVVFGYRATPEGYLRLPLDEKGRLWLEPVRLWLAWEGRAVCYDEKNNRIPDNIETKRRWEAAESRNEELQQITEEAILARQEADRRARDEERQRLDAEKRASDLAARLAELEAKLRETSGQ
jgi:Uma2 family endonuclease